MHFEEFLPQELDDPMESDGSEASCSEYDSESELDEMDSPAVASEEDVVPSLIEEIISLVNARVLPAAPSPPKPHRRTLHTRRLTKHKLNKSAAKLPEKFPEKEEEIIPKEDSAEDENMEDTTATVEDTTATTDEKEEEKEVEEPPLTVRSVVEAVEAYVPALKKVPMTEDKARSVLFKLRNMRQVKAGDADHIEKQRIMDHAKMIKTLSRGFRSLFKSNNTDNHT